MTQTAQRCPHCGLQQWRSPDGICKRCEHPLDQTPEPSPAVEPKGSGFRRWVFLAVAVGLAAVAILGVRILPGWLDMRGSPAGTWSDELSLTTIHFPDGWYHLRLDRGDIPSLVTPRQSDLEAVRGSFTLDQPHSPQAVLCWRMYSLGGSIGSQTMHDQDAENRILHNAVRHPVEAANAVYTPLCAAGNETARRDGSFSEGVDSVRERMNRFVAQRIDGRISAPAGFSSLPSGELHLTQLRFTSSNRRYVVDVLMPASRYTSLWPSIRSVIDSAEINKVVL